MCRNIRCLHNFEPPTTDDEVREAALQFVRKVSGSTRPSRANTPAFEQAIDEIAAATRTMLDQLVTNAPPKSREQEAIRAGSATRSGWNARSGCAPVRRETRRADSSAPLTRRPEAPSLDRQGRNRAVTAS